MTATTEPGQISKTQFQNNTGGWLGVVAIDPKGQDRGVSVEPGGTVWLSEAEQRLTANAPRRPEDNPFIEQTHTRRNEASGELEEYTVTPLTVRTDQRFVPADIRPIPATMAAPTALQHTQAAATGEEPVHVAGVNLASLEREHALSEAPDDIKPNEPVVPRRAAEAAAAAAETPEATDATETPEETAAAVQGDETVPSAPGETIGAATPPEGAAPEGAYVSNEEVGTPVTTTEGTDSTQPPSTQSDAGGDPAPWNG